ncbi:MAG: recombinase RecA [Nitrospirae bacterium]|nr:MAG: recombinase RecA [Nitrospirota bacterium]
MERVSTGIEGLDRVLYGGFLPQKAYLIRGTPGAGKTTLGLHFLSEGARKNEPVLYITLEEPEESIRTNAVNVGIEVEGIRFLDLSPESEFFVKVETYDIFSPAEVEREPVTGRIVEEIRSLNPKRVFIDSMTQFRYLATDVFSYRKQVLSFLRFLKEQGSTVLFTSEHSPEAPDEDLQFLSDGIIDLELHPEYGPSLRVLKFRGSGYMQGLHSYRINQEGMKVFPNVVPEEGRVELKRQTLTSGIAELDELLKGGIEEGTVTVITGPSGVGKTTLGTQFIKQAAARGETSAIYLFEENPEILIQRCEATGTHLKEMLEIGLLKIEDVEPLYYTPEEFTEHVVEDVEKRKVGTVLIDSINGYKLALRGRDLTASLHALCKQLTTRGVTVFITNETETITGEFRPTEQGLSHIADNIIFLRYLEIKGHLKKAIGVLKKRLSDFEKTLREFEITERGIVVGPPLTGLRGVLRGVPEFEEY